MRRGSDERLPRIRGPAPLFWQFVGVGGSGYGVLERLDGLTGRRLDNTGFFAVDDLDTLTDDDFYTRLLSRFPTWVHAATRVGVIR